MRFNKAKTLLFLVFMALLALNQENSFADATPKRESKASCDFDYDTSLRPYIIVQAKINGEDLPFILDTGASISLFLFGDVADKLHLTQAKNPFANLNGISCNTTIVETFQPAFYDQPARKLAAYVGGFSIFKRIKTRSGQSVAGVIGVKLIDINPVCIDFAAKRISVQPALTAAPPDTVSIPLVVEGSDRYYLSVTLPGGRPAKLLLDTGSPLTAVPAAATQGLRRPLVSRDYYGVSSGVCWYTVPLIVPEMQIAGLAEPNVAVDILPLSDLHAVIGTNFLARFNLTLDLANKRLFLKRAPDYKQRIGIPGFLALALTQTAQGVVTGKINGKNLIAAGLREKDKIVEIEGQDVRALSKPQIRALLDGEADSAVTITVERSPKERLTFRCQRASHYHPLVNPADGMILKVISGKPATVDGCAVAYPPGVHTGDQIIEINGRPTQGMASETFLQELRKPKVVITIQYPPKPKI